MNTKEMTGEQISAFADGECSDSHLELALAALRQPEGKAAWEMYHQIGDVLRSDDMAISLSPGFATRMAARLDEEPPIIAAFHADQTARQGIYAAARTNGSEAKSIKRWAMPGAIAAAVAAAAAFIATPQLMVAMKSDVSTSASTAIASATAPVKTAESIVDAEQSPVVAASVPDGVVLRDSRIDDYLLAHQRFSPSVFSSAQYARSATFETDSNK